MPDASPTTRFDDLADVYDRLIDWPRRLAREAPFFHFWFESIGARRVLDLGCGTGHHAAMFHSWGMEVVGADVSATMLARCRQHHGEGERLRWVERSFLQPLQVEKPFDAVVCVGNSLALVEDGEALTYALGSMATAMRPGGLGIIQVLNLRSLARGPIHWQKVLCSGHSGAPTILLKGVHRCGDRGYVSVVELTMGADGLTKRTHSADFLDVSQAKVTGAIRALGGEVAGVWGGYGQEPFEEAVSSDLVFVWRR